MNKMPDPTVGRIVHYTSLGSADGSYPSTCRAAMVTEVTQVEVNETNPAGDGVFRTALGLCVVNPTGLFFHRRVVQDEAGQGAGTWHWPERV